MKASKVIPGEHIGDANLSAAASVRAPVVLSECGLPIIQCCDDAPAKSMSLDELLELTQRSQFAEDMSRLSLSIP